MNRLGIKKVRKITKAAVSQIRNIPVSKVSGATEIGSGTANLIHDRYVEAVLLANVSLPAAMSFHPKMTVNEVIRMLS